MQGSTYPYISTKVTDVHGVTTTDEFKLKTVLCGRTNVYDKYRRY